MRLPEMHDTLDAVPGDVDVRLHLEDPDRIDRACHDAVSSWRDQREARGRPVDVVGHSLGDTLERQLSV